MKRALFVLAVAVMFFNTLAVPTIARADGGGGGATNCGGNQLCKP